MGKRLTFVMDINAGKDNYRYRAKSADGEREYIIVIDKSKGAGFPYLQIVGTGSFAYILQLKLESKMTQSLKWRKEKIAAMFISLAQFVEKTGLDVKDLKRIEELYNSRRKR
jgi:outer membrane lipoprotein-sorting protein